MISRIISRMANWLERGNDARTESKVRWPLFCACCTADAVARPRGMIASDAPVRSVVPMDRVFDADVMTLPGGLGVKCRRTDDMSGDSDDRRTAGLALACPPEPVLLCVAGVLPDDGTVDGAAVDDDSAAEDESPAIGNDVDLSWCRASSSRGTRDAATALGDAGMDVVTCAANTDAEPGAGVLTSAVPSAGDSAREAFDGGDWFRSDDVGVRRPRLGDVDESPGDCKCPTPLRPRVPWPEPDDDGGVTVKSGACSRISLRASCRS